MRSARSRKGTGALTGANTGAWTALRPRRRRTRLQRRDLPLPRVVDGLTARPRGLLRRMDAHAVLRRDVVEPPLRLTLQRERRRQLLGRGTARLRGHQRVDQVDDGLA